MKLLTPCAAILAALLLTGCGKTKPAAEAADGSAQTSEAAATDGQPAAEDRSGTAQQADAANESGTESGSEPADDSDDGRAEAASQPAAAEATATTWVCTWCHEEYTGSSQPTSFQPDKCERNPSHAHAWHKQ